MMALSIGGMGISALDQSTSLVARLKGIPVMLLCTEQEVKNVSSEATQSAIVKTVPRIHTRKLTLIL